MTLCRQDQLEAERSLHAEMSTWDAPKETHIMLFLTAEGGALENDQHVNGKAAFRCAELVTHSCKCPLFAW